MLKGLSEKASVAAFLPIKYFSFSREMSRADAETAILKEVWDVEIPANPSETSLLFLPPVYEGAFTYTYLQVHGVLSLADEKWQTLPVGYKTFEIEDEGGRRLIVKAAFFEIPKTQSPSRVKANFTKTGRIEYGIEQYGFALALPTSTPVLDARLTLGSGYPSQVALQAELHGFKERKDKANPRHVREYVLAEQWVGERLFGKEPPPSVVLSYGKWSEIAEAHARFYRQELANAKAKDLFKLDAEIEAIAKDPNATKLEKAHRLFKWLGSYMAYAPGGETFKLSEKYTPRPLNEILAGRVGNCLDYALLYIKLLSLADIRAEPVEVNLGDNGPVQLESKLPRRHAFNHVVVYIPELNVYIDPTDSAHTSSHPSFTLFGVASSSFANIYGLNLFSARLVLINGGRWQSNVSVSTTYTQSSDVWLGKTTWHGTGDAYRGMSLMQHRRNLRMERGQKIDRVFTDNSFSLIADSWKFSGDDIAGRASLSYSFVLRPELLDRNGQLAHVPANLMTSVVFRYLFANHLNPTLCFGSETSEELIDLRGAQAVALDPDLIKVELKGVNASFTQNVQVTDEGLKLRRVFVLDERRAKCSAAEIKSQKAFYARINEISSRTHARLARTKSK